MNYYKRFPELNSFLGAYFCLYWQDDYEWNNEEPSFEAVTKHFKADEPAYRVEATAKELEDFLNLPFSDTELAKVSDEISFNYYQGSSSEPLRKVLENLLKILKEPNNAKPLKRII